MDLFPKQAGYQYPTPGKLFASVRGVEPAVSALRGRRRGRWTTPTCCDPRGNRTLLPRVKGGHPGHWTIGPWRSPAESNRARRGCNPARSRSRGPWRTVWGSNPALGELTARCRHQSGGRYMWCRSPGSNRARPLTRRLAPRGASSGVAPSRGFEPQLTASEAALLPIRGAGYAVPEAGIEPASSRFKGAHPSIGPLRCVAN